MNKMRRYTLLFIFALLNTSVSAITVFDNNTTINPIYHWSASPTITILDDFVLTSDTTITDINYSMFTHSTDYYTQTFVSIFDSFGGSLLTSFALAGNITPNGLVTDLAESSNGFDINLNGLSLDLLAGNYVLGLTVGTIPYTFAAIGSGDSGYGSGLVQFDGGVGYYYRDEHLAFDLEGTISPVPVPAAAWLFGSALLGFFGFSRKKANT